MTPKQLAAALVDGRSSGVTLSEVEDAITEVITQAVLAERGRCEALAKDFAERAKSRGDSVGWSVADAICGAIRAERARAARIARESVADELAEKFPDARRLADQIAADIEVDQP